VSVPPADRQERGDLLTDAATLERRGIEAGHPRVLAALLAVGHVARDLPPLADAEDLLGRAKLGAVDGGANLLATLATLELAKLLVQALACTEQRAFHHGPGHPEPLSDLAVGKTFELAHDQDAVMVLGQTAERALKIADLLA
jgi:hypothetical protein